MAESDLVKYKPEIAKARLINKLSKFKYMSIRSIFKATKRFAWNKTDGNNSIVRNISLQYSAVRLYFNPNNNGIKSLEKEIMNVYIKRPYNRLAIKTVLKKLSAFKWFNFTFSTKTGKIVAETITGIISAIVKSLKDIS